MNRPVKIVQNPVLAREENIIMIVRLMWETYHPWQIADHINARYGFTGCFELGQRHVENYRQMIRRLDREAIEG